MNYFKSFQYEMMNGYTYLNINKHGSETWSTIARHLRKTKTFINFSGTIRSVLRGVMVDE